MKPVSNRVPNAIWSIGALTAVSLLAFLSGCSVAVTTYHYNNLRTGWNSDERKLAPSNVNASSLSVETLTLDDANDQVDAQPLIVPRVHLAGGRHDVVYLATENNNIYAIDANTDTKLLKVNLGPAVPLPLGCSNNGPTVGVNGTPAIDQGSKTLYVISYVLDSSHGNAPAYYIHALNLNTLTDRIPPRLVTASGTLSNGNPITFSAAYQRQRPGLLLANGNIYAGFGSFCDWGGSSSRGWVLGWQASSLTPLPANELNNSQTSEPQGMYLSSVWESGYGITGDRDGNIVFTTGNSDASGTTYDGCTNIQESVVKLPSTLVRTCAHTPLPSSSLFTPANWSSLDVNDVDVGSAGVMELPPMAGSVPNLLVSNAKDGSMFLLNRDNLGGLTPTNAGALGGVQSIGAGCWCGPAYFNDGSPHVVTSGGGWNGNVTTNNLKLWNLQTSPSPSLANVASGGMPDTIQDPGFLTTVSSHGVKNAIIWAVSRPLSNSESPSIWLYAFNAKPSASTLQPLFPGAVAGSWPNTGGNANIVPVVANGKVYVASNRELEIFGLRLQNGAQATSRKAAAAALTLTGKIEFPKGPEEHRVSGTVRKVDGTKFTIETRDHRMVDVDAGEAQNASRYPTLVSGNGVVVAGLYAADGLLRATSVFRSKVNPATWPPDR